MTYWRSASPWQSPEIRKLFFHCVVAADMALLFILATVPGFWNLHGAWLPAWPLPLDLLLFGALYYLLFRPAPQEFLIKSVLFAAAGLTFGYLALPNVRSVMAALIEQNKVALALTYGAFELLVLGLLVHKVRGMLRASGNVDQVLRASLADKFGKGWLGRLAHFEARIWYYGLFMRKDARLQFAGQQHFSYANNDGNIHHQFCLVMLLIFDMPLSHCFIHFALSARLAWLMTALETWNLLYFVAQYRASKVRPVSLSAATLHIRYGVLSRDLDLPLHLVARAVPMQDTDPRQRGEWRYRQFGALNVMIELRDGAHLPNVFGLPRPVRRIAISIDDPLRFMQSLNRAAGGRHGD